MKDTPRPKKTLTRAEEDVMQYLWQLGKATVKEITACFPAPRPAYNTVSTIIRILEDKGFVAHEKEGRGHRYHPLIDKSEYSYQTLDTLAKGYFGGSFKTMVSFFMKKSDIGIGELEAILEDIKKAKKP